MKMKWQPHDCTGAACSFCLALDQAQQEQRRREWAGQAQVFAAMDVVDPPRFLVVGLENPKEFFTWEAMMTFIASELNHVPAVLDRRENTWVTGMIQAALEDLDSIT